MFTSSSLPQIQAVSAGTSELFHFFSSSNVGSPLGKFFIAVSIVGSRISNRMRILGSIELQGVLYQEVVVLLEANSMRGKLWRGMFFSASQPIRSRDCFSVPI